MDSPLVSIVILTWNRKDDLRDSLGKLRSNSYKNLQIIVVDNNSTDDTGEMLSAEYPWVEYLPQNENLGIAGYNIGFRDAKGDFVVALDSDSYPAVDAIEKMVKLFSENRTAGAVAFEVHTPTKQSEETTIELAEAADVIGYHGAGVGFRREVFQKVGYWYEPFFLYFNEMDHALRMIKRGYRIIQSPAVRAFHKSSKTARPSKRNPYYYARNALWLIWRHYPFWKMLGATFHFIYLAVSESVHQGTSVYINALRDAFSNVSEVIAEREPLKSSVFKNAHIPLPLIFSRWA